MVRCTVYVAGAVLSLASRPPPTTAQKKLKPSKSSTHVRARRLSRARGLFAYGVSDHSDHYYETV